MYKDRIQQLIETLNIKLSIIEKVANGTMKLSNADTNNIIAEMKQLLERITNLVENER